MAKTGDEDREPGQHMGSRAGGLCSNNGGVFSKGVLCGLQCMESDVFT